MAAPAESLRTTALSRLMFDNVPHLKNFWVMHGLSVAQLSLNPADPGSTFILVPQDNGELKPKRFAGCTTRELRRALEHLRSPSTYLPVSPASLAIYERLRDVLFERLGVRVLMRNVDGTTMLDFEGVPIERVKEFAEVLRELSPEIAEQLLHFEEPQPH